MFKSICKKINLFPFLKINALSMSLMPSFGSKISYKFSNNQLKEVQKSIQQSLDTSLQLQLNRQSNFDEGVQYFQGYGFKINFVKNRFIQMNRSYQNYQIVMVVKGTSLMQIDNSDKQRRMEMAQQLGPEAVQMAKDNKQDQNIAQVNIYIKKNGFDKWMFSNFLVTLDESVQLQGLGLVDDIQQDKRRRYQSQNPVLYLQGPQLGVLDNDFQQNWYKLLQQVGCSATHIEASARLAGLYEHKVYIKWLQQMRQMF